MGTDTISGIRAAQQFYGPSNEMFGFSIPASEHSTMTILGPAGEVQQFERMIDKFGKPNSMFACVSDSYSIYDACKSWGTTLKDKLIKSGATLVVRPDSGNPVEVSLETIKTLEKYFGSKINEKGYKVLNTVRVIYGDGINYQSINEILVNITNAGYSSDNISFGMGGALLQGINRDTLRFAMKASWAQINGEEYEVYKQPSGDITKASKKGKVKSYKSNIMSGWISTATPPDILSSEWVPMMTTVFENGVLLKSYSFDEVRKNANE
jgi:nicotinamide phosphoribosyltransferase